MGERIDGVAADLIKNEKGYFLNVPKVKQRKSFRNEFNMVMIEKFLYDSLSMLINENQVFVEDKFIAALPATVKRIAVMDRTKEPGSAGEPLLQDVQTALFNAEKTGIKVCGGRYSLGQKEFTPSMVNAVYENLASAEPKKRFTVGIDDDVTGLSLPVTKQIDPAPEGTFQGLFYGLGSDGTVGANKNSIKIIGDHTDMYAQGYFFYDSKKS
ncbi:MAG: hypothetical protein KH420_04835, partial [Clostridiales bacterium]|nr:hypothetical protein [Clostridiales bacterium]